MCAALLLVQDQAHSSHSLKACRMSSKPMALKSAGPQAPQGTYMAARHPEWFKHSPLQGEAPSND